MFYLLYLPMDPVHGLEASCFRVVHPSGLMVRVCMCAGMEALQSTSSAPPGLRGLLHP